MQILGNVRVTVVANSVPLYSGMTETVKHERIKYVVATVHFMGQMRVKKIISTI